ncbi:MAG TPA: hypothetical protein VMP11_20900 [Verrucomicrobiae bacterium]|nr:hypothetical protein [Verrucomicrobiae bacterium]
MNNKVAFPGLSSQRHSALNILGVAVLALGLTAASIVLLRANPNVPGAASGDWQDNSLSIQDSKASSRDVEMYDGKLGLLTVKLSNTFHQPESLAMIIAAGSTLFALGCFIVARRLPPPDPPIGTKDFSP